LDFPIPKEKKVVGGGYRLNTTCPRCQSYDRERLEYLFLKKRTDLFARKIKLLHFAPEENLQKVLSTQPNIDYLTADLMAPDVMVKVDVTAISYPDDTFDAVICNHVLEHVPDDRRAMAELYRVLKPGGWAYLQVPMSLSLAETYEDPSITTPQGRQQAFGQADHVRIYARDYKDRLEGAGFLVTVHSFARELRESSVRRYALLKDEDVYLCTKPSRPAS